MTDGDKPPPGSDEAIELGCLCPVLDNGRGKGYLGMPGVFVFAAGCPIHPWPERAKLDLNPTLTPEEEAEAQRLYAEFLDQIAKGNTWGLNPKDDR